MQPTRFAVFYGEPRHASHCVQLGKPRTLVGGGAGDSHRRPAVGSLTDGNGFGGYGAENAGPWAHPNKRRRSSHSNSNISSQGAPSNPDAGSVHQSQYTISLLHACFSKSQALMS